MEHELWVRKSILPLFEVTTCRKDLEVRVSSAHFDRVVVNDVFFVNRLFKRSIAAIRRYPDFEAMLKMERFERIYPGLTSTASAVEHLREIYSRPREAQGVIVFELREFAVKD